MIASLKGVVQVKLTDRIILDVNGVGYDVLMAESSLFSCPNHGEELFLYIYSHIREDAFLLFGFVSPLEKQTFQLLLSVSGVGPKVALAILSDIPPVDFSRAISADDIGRLTKISGIGKKTAERLVLELKDKVEFIPASDLGSPVNKGEKLSNSSVDDAVSALLNLGYHSAKADEAVRTVVAVRGEDIGLQDLIRLSLQFLSSE